MDANLFLAFSDTDGWHPGIGDPTVMGWLTVVAYFMTASLCWRAGQRSAGPRTKIRWFWISLMGLLIALGINKQLDLQTAFTFMGRTFAKSTGWYDNRRAVQFIFIILIGIGGLAFTVWLLWFFRRELPRLWTAIAGVGFLTCFIVVRAASFHHVDRFLMHGPGEIRMNWILELGSIGVIAWSAWRAARRSAENGFVWVSRERQF